MEGAVTSARRVAVSLRDRVPEFHGSTTPVPLTCGPLSGSDSSLARALADAALGATPFAGSLFTALERALARATDEYQSIVARDGNALAGFVVFGEIAGTLRTGRIHLIAVAESARRRGVAIDLINAACDRLRERGSPLVVIELPMDPALATIHQLAQRAGFREEGRMADYVRDGIALVLLRRDLGTRPSDSEAAPGSV
jgi:ribosomal protein S18 acetylase RimI-like enzyme